MKFGKMSVIKKIHPIYKCCKLKSVLYNISGHISISVKNLESISNSISFRQFIQSISPVIIGHMIPQHENWINAGAIIVEHLSRKFVPKALKWLKHVNPNTMNVTFHFKTHIKGYSLQSIDCDNERTLHGTSIAEWNEYPYRISYKFHFKISSAAKNNYKYMAHKNYAGYKLCDGRFKKYIEAIIMSQSTQVYDWLYDIDKAMQAVMFLVE